jgi:hypothetical protein
MSFNLFPFFSARRNDFLEAKFLNILAEGGGVFRVSSLFYFRTIEYFI